MPEIKEKRWILLWRSNGKGKWLRIFPHKTFRTKNDLIRLVYRLPENYYNEKDSGKAKAVRATVTITWDNPVEVQP